MIADDEPLARELLRALLAELPNLIVVGEASDGLQAIAAVEQHRPDLVLLDIDMPGLNGGHAALRIVDAGADVVFVTAHDGHALEAFDIGAADYLLKPVRRPRLAAAVERARGRRRTAPATAGAPPADLEPPLWVPGRNGAVRVAIADIQRVEAAGDHVQLHTAQRAHLYRTTMSAIEARLQGSGLLRTHRSAFVRPELVVAVQREGRRLTLRLEDGGIAPVGAGYREQVLAALAARGR